MPSQKLCLLRPSQIRILICILHDSGWMCRCQAGVVRLRSMGIIKCSLALSLSLLSGIAPLEARSWVWSVGSTDCVRAVAASGIALNLYGNRPTPKHRQLMLITLLPFGGAGHSSPKDSLAKPPSAVPPRGQA